MAQTFDAHLASFIICSPTGKLHACRASQVRTVCGLDTQRKRFRRTAGCPGWVRIPGLWSTYLDKADGRTCLTCQAGLLESTGPGA